MSWREARPLAVGVACAVALGLLGGGASADELIYRYEGDVLIQDPVANWTVFDECQSTCAESVENQAFTLRWSGPGVGVSTNYDHVMAASYSDLPQPPFWLEWGFSSSTQFGAFLYCDGRFSVHYFDVAEGVNMHGDAVTSASGGDSITGLERNAFHTHRFESEDGINYCFSVDGMRFSCGVGNRLDPGTYLQTGGDGGCGQFPSVNKWDFIRYGRITEGEAIVSSDPPSGILSAGEYPALDRFTVTFDQPNYVYIDDVSVSTLTAGIEGSREQGIEGTTPLSSPLAKGGGATAGGAPTVIATRRLDNGPPETVQIVLDRALEVGVTYRFTFATGGTPNTVEYTLLFPTGACCDLLSGACTEGLTLDECSGVHQAWTEATACAQAACEAVTGACCDGDPFDACTDGLTQAQCQCPTCQWTKEALCDNVDCPRSVIPTVSLWGLTVLALLLLIAAKLRLRPAYSSIPIP